MLAMTPRSCVIMMMEVLISLFQGVEQVEDLRLNGHVQRRGRLVGDDQPRVARNRHARS